MYLPMLTDRELLAQFEATRDPLTTTELEVEIAKRFEKLLDAEEERAPIDEILGNAGIDDAELTELLQACDEHAICTATELRERLKRADAFYDIASDAGDVLHRLQDLINQCQ